MPIKINSAILLFFFLVLWLNTSYTQSIAFPIEINAEVEFDNVHVKKWSETEHSSTFIIWVKNEVKPHYHELHTEHVVVLEGEGIMLLGDSLFEIKKDMLIFIPSKTIHAVICTSKIPLKVISFQSPKFDDNDRIWAKTKLWPPNILNNLPKSRKKTNGY